MRSIFLILLTSLFFLFFPSTSYASDLVINEYFPNPEGSAEGAEWIELFNTTNSELDISNWKIDDLAEGGSGVYTFPADTKISGHSFYILERAVSGIILNNDTDIIRVLDPLDQIVDEYTYSETEEGVSYGRSIDGEGTWIGFTVSTKGSSNSQGQVIFTPTPTILPTEIPTKTPLPTKTPTLTKVPTIFPTKIITSTPISITSILPTRKLSPTVKLPTFAKKPSKKVLAVTIVNKISPTLEPSKYLVKSSVGFNPGIVAFIVGGVFLVACGILTFYLKKKQQL